MDKKSKTKKSSAPFQRKPLITALEPRILLDGAAVATTAEMTTDVAFQQNSTPDTPAAPVEGSVVQDSEVPAVTGNNTSSGKTVAFIDTSISDYQQLVDSLDGKADVYLIGADNNGLAIIADTLQGQSGIEAVHIYSHGDDGEIQLGNTTINQNTIESYSDVLNQIGNTLSDNGDILLYGCYVGSNGEGQTFINRFAELTGADVAASDDLTGASALGGDWELEARSGEIEASPLVVTGYEGVLAPVITQLANSVAFTEGGSPVIVDSDIAINGGSSYTEGYIRFSVTDSNAGDQFTLTSAGDINASGAISVDGNNDVFLGNGSGRDRIGSIDAVENGQNGQPLKILFSSPLPNAGFEDDAANWDIVNQQYGDSAGEINFDNYTIPLANRSGYSGGYGTTKVQPNDDTSFTGTIASGQGVDGSKALYLHSSGDIFRGDADSSAGEKTDGYGSIHGPYATSDVVTVADGDSLSLDFNAKGTSDDYEVFGVLRRVDGDGNFIDSTDVGTENTRNNIVLFAERGDDTNGYKTVTYNNLQAGNYRFQFIGGTYDYTGGLLVGSNLYVDNIRLISSTTVNDSVASTIARQVAYQNTADDAPTSRTMTVEAADSNGGIGSDTTTLNISLTNDAPSFSGNATLASVNEDTLSPAGSTVNSLFTPVFTDPDAAYDPKDTLAGIVITADSSTESQGTWQYSTNGSDWHEVGAVSSDTGLMLSSDTLIRFNPAENYHGTPGSLSVHAVDSSTSLTFTDGSNREAFDTGSDGQTSSVSAAPAQLETMISPQNDNPTVTAGTPSSTLVEDSGTENSNSGTSSSVINLTTSDIDAGDSVSFDTAFLTSQGWGSADGGLSYSKAGTYGSATLTITSGQISYQLNNTDNDTEALAEGDNATDSFTIQVQDTQGGSDSVEAVFYIQGGNDTPLFVEIIPQDNNEDNNPPFNGTNPGEDTEALDNGQLKFGTGSQDSVNSNTGMLEQPFYYRDGERFKLTYSNYALNMAIGSGGDGSDDWNLNGEVNKSPTYSNVEVDNSGYFNGSGIIIFKGNITVDGTDLEVTHTYSLGENDAFIKVTTSIRNLDNNPTDNLRIWVGTKDDYIAGSDSPAKTKGNIINGVFTPTTSADQPASAIQVYSGDSAVLFYSTSDKVNTIIHTHYNWDQLLDIDPAESIYQQPADDGSYGMYIRLDDLAAGESESFDWFYTAGALSQVNDIVYQIALDSSDGLTETNGTLSSSGELTLLDHDLTDEVSVSISGVSAVQKVAFGEQIPSSSLQPSLDELLPMLSLDTEQVLDSQHSTGTVNWSFDSAGEAFDYLKIGEQLVLTYTLTATDNHGASSTHALDITINGRDDAPTHNLPSTPVIDEDSALVFSDANNNAITIGITDEEQLTTTLIVNNSAGTLLITNTEGVTVNNNGSASVQLTGSRAEINAALQGLTFQPAANRYGSASLTIASTDSSTTQTDTLLISIQPVNDAPVANNDSGLAIESGGTQNATAGSDAAGNVLDNDTDIDTGDSLIVSGITFGNTTLAVSESNTTRITGDFGTLEIGADGSYRYVIDETNPAVQALRTTGQQITDTFSYQIKDSGDPLGENTESLEATGQLTIAIDGRNDQPVALDTAADEEWDFGRTYTKNIALLFTDTDTSTYGEDLDFTITGLPPGLTYDADSGIISGAPTRPGTFIITMTATDRSGASISREYQLEVIPPAQESTKTTPTESNDIPAPDIDTTPVETQLSDLPDGLVDPTGNDDPSDDSGFLEGSATPTSFEIEAENIEIDTRPSIMASVDVNVTDSGEVVFTDDQLQAFDVVSMRIDNIDHSSELLQVSIVDNITQDQIYTGTLGDGTPLPEWVTVDSETGSVSANPPEDEDEVIIRVKATGYDGNIRILEIKLNLQQLRDNNNTGDTATNDQTVFVPFSEQVTEKIDKQNEHGEQLVAALKPDKD